MWESVIDLKLTKEILEEGCSLQEDSCKSRPQSLPLTRGRIVQGYTGTSFQVGSWNGRCHRDVEGNFQTFLLDNGRVRVKAQSKSSSSFLTISFFVHPSDRQSKQRLGRSRTIKEQSSGPTHLATLARPLSLQAKLSNPASILL